MKILNVNKGCILADKIFLADNFLARIRGLLGFRSLGRDQAMIIRPCNCVHTFFMRFPIDVLFISRDNIVVKIIRQMRPFRASLMCVKAKFVIELPFGVADFSKTSIGDTLQIQ